MLNLFFLFIYLFIYLFIMILNLFIHSFIYFTLAGGRFDGFNINFRKIVAENIAALTSKSYFSRMYIFPLTLGIDLMFYIYKKVIQLCLAGIALKSC